MNVQFLLAALFGLILGSASAAPLHLTVTQKGTNQIVFTLNPVISNVYYAIYGRPDNREALWLGLTGVVGNSNKTANTIYELKAFHLHLNNPGLSAFIESQSSYPQQHKA